MLKDLKGQIAFITGGSRGIGKATALALAKEGANICVTARSADALEQVVSECKQFGVQAMSVVSDASDYEGLKSALDTCVKEFGGVSIIVSNAGVLGMASQSFEQWEKCIQVNLLSVMALCSHAIQYLEKNESSSIIQISSIAATRHFKAMPPYCGSKAGVNGYLLSLFEQVRDKNIKVCVISPGMVNTDMVTSFGKNHEDMIQVDDIAETISFVAKFPKNSCPTEITILPQVSEGLIRAV